MSSNSGGAAVLLKKKKDVPVPPASVSSAHLLVHGTLCGFVGSSVAPLSLLQHTYLTDGYESGKFSVNLGKRCGTACALSFPPEPQPRDVDELLDGIEVAVNRLLHLDLPITTFSPPPPHMAHLLNATADQNTVAYIPNLILALPAGPVLTSTGQIASRILLERDSCALTAGKKARKCDIVIKFRLVPPTSTAATIDRNLIGAPTPEELEPLFQHSSIRLEEGLHYCQTRLNSDEEDAVSSTVAADGPIVVEGEEMVVNAFEVSGKIDYAKLVDEFGSKPIDAELLARLEALTVGRGTVPRLHHFLTRDIFFSHRDLDKICTCLETANNSNDVPPMYLYTGRGPSSQAMHLGHLIPFLFTQWLQQAFQCPLVIQMTDDEKFLFQGTYDEQTGDNLDHFASLSIENAKDILACGFLPHKTFLFSDLHYVGRMYPNIVRIWKAVTTNTVQGIFGFDGSSNIGKVAFPAIQAAPSFSSSFPIVLGGHSNIPCLIPCAIDQDPYFRLTRDVAHKLTSKSHPLEGKPALIHSKFFPPLQGAKGKMSSSNLISAILLTDTMQQVEEKITKHAHSGGRDTKELQQLHGANLSVDVPYQWLTFFFQNDDELRQIHDEYSTGKGQQYWSTAHVKRKLIQVVQTLVHDHQERRAKVTNDMIQHYMSERSIL